MNYDEGTPTECVSGDDRDQDIFVHSTDKDIMGFGKGANYISDDFSDTSWLAMEPWKIVAETSDTDPPVHGHEDITGFFPIELLPEILPGLI